jgi:hypothetical protein
MIVRFEKGKAAVYHMSLLELFVLGSEEEHEKSRNSSLKK